MRVILSLKTLKKVRLFLPSGRKKTSLGDDVGNEKENVFETKHHRCETYCDFHEDDDEDG